MKATSALWQQIWRMSRDTVLEWVQSGNSLRPNSTPRWFILSQEAEAPVQDVFLGPGLNAIRISEPKSSHHQWSELPEPVSIMLESARKLGNTEISFELKGRPYVAESLQGSLEREVKVTSLNTGAKTLIRRRASPPPQRTQHPTLDDVCK